MGVTAIIPAYNEAITIGKIVAVVQQQPLVKEIIVVDDGSGDGTAAVARAGGAKVIELPENRGKGNAMATGARQAKGDVLIFLDADLDGLTPGHIRNLLEPVLQGQADMTVGVFSNGRKATDFAQVLAPGISGQRAIRKELFLAAGVDDCRFEVEMILSRFARKRGLRVQKIPLFNMTHIMKEEKRGVARGIVERAGMYKDITFFFWKAGCQNKKVMPLVIVCLTLFLGFSLISYSLVSIKMARAGENRLIHFNFEGGNRRILVIAPHPDDEVLATGGLIIEAVRRNYPVQVVFLTSGDGFEPGLEIYKRKIRPESADFLSYGSLRMEESRQALQELGIKSDAIVFLGYPDGGLESIWWRHWAGEQPYCAAKTQQKEVPYDEARSSGAAYIAPNILQDLIGVMQDFQPTDIFLPDLDDSHPDHRTGGAIALAAAASRMQSEPSHNPRLFTYLVHAGMWQVVPKVDKNALLLPPRNLMNRSTTWYTLSLTQDIMDQKKLALEKYQSQMKVIPSFLNNFLRPNEVFSQVRLADLKLPPSSHKIK